MPNAQNVPAALFGVCGGSGSLSFDFPAALDDERVTVLAENLVFETPFGMSPGFTHFRIEGPHGPREALAVKMHGWRRGVKRADASLQVFWVFHEAGVRKVVADGGVGSLNHLLDPRDIVIPNDFIDLSMKQDIYVRGDHLLIMREPICPELSSHLYAGASESFARVFARGTYLVTDGPRFESVAEVDYMKRLGGDVIGQSLAPEVFLARDIGACYAGIYIVVNYGEGVVREWEHSELKAVFFDESETIARIVLDTVADADLSSGACRCAEFRKPSLLGLPDEREVAPVLVSADWVVPVNREPVRDGAVVTCGDTIVGVGPRSELEARYPAEPRSHFAGCVISPGLVNAHTHLTLTALAGVVPSLPFAQWLPRLVAALKPWEIADHEASGVVGAELSLAAGVTVVGDIAYGAAEVTSASRAGLGGVYYWEVLGLDAAELQAELTRLRYPGSQGAFGARVVPGLSPHSPYTSGPALLRAVHDAAERFGAPVAIHVAESDGESELMHLGTGPLAPVASRTAEGFTVPETGSVAYLGSLGVLDGTTAVHLCQLEDGDIGRLAASVRGAVTCPRSNLYLHNTPPLIEPLLAAGIAVGVGTDSAASNADLDLLGDVRALHVAEPGISARTLVEIATVRGAAAIGVGDRFGALAAGLQADLAVFAVGPTQEPERALVERGGADCARAVLSGGTWRVLDGDLVAHDALAASRATRARQASLDVIGLT